MQKKANPKTILLADDDYDFRLQQRLQLEAAGFRVREAESRKKACELLASTTFDLALVDLMMEEMDAGFSLCHEIKARCPDTPIIMVTGVARETGLEFGVSTEEERTWIKADALLAKPIRFEQMLREIARLLKE
ncbi:MAG: response regulator [Candidatus Hydrogenedentes bacterium]|nr:response regulator [Candidatus Hydrogenedentota bacterium]